MKKFIHILTKFFIPLLLTFIIAACKVSNEPEEKKNDPTASKTKSNQAYSLMESEFFKWVNGSYHKPSDFDNLTFTQANTLYKDALALDANNKDAQFGAAITEMLVAYSDPDINKIIKQFDSSMNNNSLEKVFANGLIPFSTSQMNAPIGAAATNLFAIHNLALTDPPLISKVQEVMRDKLLPRVTYAIDRLSVLESDTTFSFIVSGRMQGDPTLQPYKLYCTEAGFSNGLMYGLKFIIEEFLIYQFPLQDYKQATLINALSQNNTTFFVLATDGTTRAANAKNALTSMINKIQNGIHYLETFSGKKNDAVIKMGSGGIKQNDLDTVKTYLNKMLNALNQDVTVELKAADTDGNDYTIKVNLGNFFNNLPTNPKQAFLPTYTVVASGSNDIHIKFSAQTYSQFTFPDPTFGGVFPGMTNETMKRLMYIDHKYAFLLEGRAYYASWSSFGGNEGVSNATIKIVTQNNNYTCITKSDGEYSLYVRSATTTPERILKYYINYGDGDVELVIADTNMYIDVLSKTHLHYEIEIPYKPTSLTGKYYNNPYRVELNWLVNGSNGGNGYYAIERKEGSGSFTELAIVDYYNFNDYSVSPGITYQYRIRSNSKYYSNYKLQVKNELYSNIIIPTP